MCFTPRLSINAIESNLKPTISEQMIGIDASVLQSEFATDTDSNLDILYLAFLAAFNDDFSCFLNKKTTI